MNRQIGFFMLQGMERFGLVWRGVVRFGKAWHGLSLGVCDVESVKIWKTK
jgi:hypothetical protein